MTVWYKMGVCGDLTTPAQKCEGRIARMYKEYDLDLHVTCHRDGTHMDGSLHYTGNAFDFRKELFNLNDIRNIAGIGFDCVEHEYHFHVEYDPKP